MEQSTMDTNTSPLPPGEKSEVSPLSGSTWAPLGNLSRTVSQDSFSSATTLPPADYLDFTPDRQPPAAALVEQDQDDDGELDVTLLGIQVFGIQTPEECRYL